MMIEQATVISYQNGIAKVQCQAKLGCGSCLSQSSCGTKSLSALAGEKTAPQFAISVPQVLAEGDRIEIGIAEQRLLTSVFWLYGIPLFVLIVSTLLFSQWFENEIFVVMAMLFSTAIAFISIKRILMQKSLADFMPIFLRKL